MHRHSGSQVHIAGVRLSSAPRVLLPQCHPPGRKILVWNPCSRTRFSTPRVHRRPIPVANRVQGCSHPRFLPLSLFLTTAPLTPELQGSSRARVPSPVSPWSIVSRHRERAREKERERERCLAHPGKPGHPIPVPDLAALAGLSALLAFFFSSLPFSSLLSRHDPTPSILYSPVAESTILPPLFSFFFPPPPLLLCSNHSRSLNPQFLLSFLPSDHPVHSFRAYPFPFFRLSRRSIPLPSQC